ncbi:MAG: hypothetical protein AAGJ78_04695 [Pseudomonadota bacterium]
MSEDIDYCPAVSIYKDDGNYALAAKSLCHRPCENMAGMEKPDPAKRQRALFLLGKLREKHGLDKPAPERRFKKMDEHEKRHFLSRLKEKSLRLPKRAVERSPSNEAA